MDYWQNTRGFNLTGTADKNVMLASNEREKKFLLIRYNWFTDKYEQFTPIQRTREEALAGLTALVTA